MNLYSPIQSILKLYLILVFSTAAVAQEVVPVWTYYPSAPFTTGEGEGLNNDFIDMLNNYSRNNQELENYRFDLRLIPRTRINRNLQNNVAGLVIFVNWVWMGDKDKTRYLWSDPILSDRNEIASRAAGKTPMRVEYSDATSLKGMVFGGVTGRVYKGLQKAFKSGDIKRIDVRNEAQNLDLLLNGRIDVTSIAASVINYQLKEKNIEQDIYYSSRPLISYTRHLLITQDYSHLLQPLNQFLSELEKNTEWQVIKKKYAVR